MRGWGDCDDFCTHAFGELIIQNTSLVKKVIPWAMCEEFWMRRAAVVVLINSSVKNEISFERGRQLIANKELVNNMTKIKGKDIRDIIFV